MADRSAKRAEIIAWAVRAYHAGRIDRAGLGRVIATFAPRSLHTRGQPM